MLAQQKPRLPENLAAAPQAVINAFQRASVPKKVAMIAAGVVVVGASPYWMPAVWRSKQLRRLAMLGAGHAFSSWIG